MKVDLTPGEAVAIIVIYLGAIFFVAWVVSKLFGP